MVASFSGFQEEAFRQRLPGTADVYRPARLAPQPVGIQQERYAGSWKSYLDMRLNILEDQVRRLREPDVGYVSIRYLPTKRLRTPLDVIVQRDGDGYTARAVDLPLYGHGDDPKASIDMLKREIESLYDDLMEDSAFSEDWLRIKDFLAQAVGE